MIKGWAELCHTRNYNKLKFDLRNIVNLFAKEEAIEVNELDEGNISAAAGIQDKL